MVIRRNVLKGILTTVAGLMAFKPAFASLERNIEPSEQHGIYSAQKLFVAVAINNESDDCIAAAKVRALQLLSESSDRFFASHPDEPIVRIDSVPFSFHGENRLRKCVIAENWYWLPDSYMPRASQRENEVVKISVDRSRR